MLIVRRLLASVLPLLLLLAWPSSLLAHGVLTRAEPAASARLAVAPTVVRLTFSEAMEPAVSRIALIGPDGANVALSPVRGGDSAAVLVADITGSLMVGSYTVVWQGAGRDGHPIHGQYQFTVAPAATGMPAVGPPRDRASRVRRLRAQRLARAAAIERNEDSFDSQSPIFSAIRCLQLVVILALIGTVGFALFVLPRAARRGAPETFVIDADRSARSTGLTAAVMLLVVVAALRLLAQDVALRGDEPFDADALRAIIMGTMWGHAWLLQLVASLVACGGFLLIARARLAGWALVVLSTIAVVLATSLSGHAAAAPVQPGFAVFKDLVHLLAVGGWLGTLLLIAIAGMPAALRLTPGGRSATVATMVNVFSPFALICTTLVAISGVASAWAHLGQLGALWTTGYGRVLLIKLGVIVVLMAVGAFNWRVVRPSLGDEEGANRIERSATVELIVAALVIAVTSVLMATPTPSAAQTSGRDRAVQERVQ